MSMQIFVDSDPASSAQREAHYLVGRLEENPAVTFGGATGRTQLLVYGNLHDLVRGRQLTLGETRICFVDEYFGGFSAYYHYSQQHLRVGEPGSFASGHVCVPRGCFYEGDRIVNSQRLEEILEDTKGEWEARTEPGEEDIPPEIHILPSATHPVLRAIGEANARYDDLVRSQGPNRLQLLGVGTQGHIGFVERGAAAPDSGVMLVRLAPRTLSDNDSDFSLVNADGNRVELERSRFAVTQGIATILSAGELLMAAHGPNKESAVRDMLLGEPGPQNPAAFIQRHPKVHVYLDREAFGALCGEELQERGYEVDVRTV